jgi:23S rRNA U2552 (ribose-2'-O)-methylase RlmE/FtsJ
MISTNITKYFDKEEISDGDLIAKLYEKNHALCQSIRRAKNKINNQKKWDIAKKFTNVYEFIFSFNNEGVADIVPISRSFFKLVEIVSDNTMLIKQDLRAACICEGPGGFIQGLMTVCQRKNIHIQSIDAITLISRDRKIPAWKVQANDVIRLHYGKNGLGDIYDVENIEHFARETGTNTCDIVTADGGFDFSSDFNSQERNFIHLLVCEIYTALLVQSINGHLMIKIFDLFDAATIQLLALLCELYEEVKIQKPCTSRPANSEKYIVCLRYKTINTHLIASLRQCVLSGGTSQLRVEPRRYHNTLRHVVEFNAQIVRAQTMCIENTISLIREGQPFDKMKYESSCVDWCNRYGIPIKRKIRRSYNNGLT